VSPLERDRKLKHQCMRCGVELGAHEHTNLCRTHQLDVNARNRASYARRHARAVIEWLIELARVLAKLMLHDAAPLVRHLDAQAL
jgi:hypothetical protein